MKKNTSIIKNLCAQIVLFQLLLHIGLASTQPHFHSGLCAVKHGEKWGFIDKTGKVAIPFIWDDVKWSLYGKGFREGFAAVKRNGKWGFISKDGKPAFPITWESVESFHEGMAAVQVEDKWGFIDTTGTLVAQAEWDSVGAFSDGLASVRRSTDKGYINKEGKLIIPLFKEAHGFGNSGNDSFASGLAVTAQKVRVDRMAVTRFGFIDKTGAIAIPIEWEEANKFSDGLAAVKKDGKIGFIDSTGKVVIQPTIDSSMPGQENSFYTTSFSNGLARVANDGKFGFIDKSGKIVISCDWNMVLAFNESGLCAVQGDKGWGFIDTTGKVIIEPIWHMDYYNSFHEGLVPIEQDGKIGFIDRHGKLVILFDTKTNPE